MGRKRTGRRSVTPLPISAAPDPSPRPRRRIARWRAFSLSLVYLIFAIHILHWKVTGKTLAPLELNEVMYTLELGIITAGFLFMCFLVLGTLVFGRFFCSWACHILVLQDLCAWMLRKFGIRRKPIRARLLLLVPPLTAFYMFIWPQILRAWESRALPEFHLRTDVEGWASFATNNFWRNLPSAPVIVLTFLVCGFAIVYLLGSRTFCTYVCPYGAVFGLADRFAPGRIRVNDKCVQCGTCTAACTSGVRVHEEVKQHGMIVNSACLKDLDCLSACPNDALHYKLGRPSLFKSYAGGGRFGRLGYDFSMREEILLGLVFLTVLFSFRGLYSRVPFLLSLALGGIIGYLAVTLVRVATRPDVRLATMKLRAVGRLTGAGRLYVAFTVLLAAFVGHSAFVRYHEYTGLRQGRAMAEVSLGPDRDGLASSAYAHLVTADRWGLIDNERAERGLVDIAFHLRRFDDVETYAMRFLSRFPYDSAARLRLGEALAETGRRQSAGRQFGTIIAQWDASAIREELTVASAYQARAELLLHDGRFALAERDLRAALGLDAERSALHAALGSVLAEMGRLEDAVVSLREAVQRDPALARAQYNLGTILAHLGRPAEAIPCYRAALGAGPDDPDVHNNLGLALSRTGEAVAARSHFERAIAIDPGNAHAHFNLASLLAADRNMDDATEHYRIAARLDPRYRQPLNNGPTR